MQNFMQSLKAGDGWALFCDNHSYVNIAKDLTSIITIKYLEGAYLWSQEKFQEGRVTLEDIPMQEKRADIFTNNLSHARFEYLKSKTWVLPAMSHSGEKS